MPLWHVWDENPEKIFGYALGVIKLLKEGERIYLHCSAGIHRTGTVSYFILRESGYTHERALELIIHERPVVETELKMALSHMDLTYMKVKKAEAKRLGREVK